MENSNGIVLPNHRDLSSSLLGFLEVHFSDHDNLSSISSTARDLENESSQKCNDFNTDLVSLRGSLGKLIVAWICRSIGSKAALHKLNLNIQNLSSHYGVGSSKMLKILGEDLPPLVKELRQLDNVRNYSEITLKLEALVGDFEDAVLFVMKRHTRDIFSANLLKSAISTDLGPRQNQLFQAVKAASVIENLLVTRLNPQWVHLIKSVDTRVGRSLAGLRTQVVADHRALLASLGWPPKVLTSKIENGTILDIPNPLVLMQVDKRKNYSESFLVLCALQHLQVQREKRQLDLLGDKKKTNVGLWAIDELVSPIASRTEYHFSKWVDQPELIFTLVYKITRDFVVGVDDVLQPLIDRARLGSYSAREAWVYAMVQMVSGFLAKRVFSVLAERYKEKQRRPEVMLSWAHMIDLMVAFDRQMQSLVSTETFLLFGGSERPGESLQGISVLSIFYDRPDWLKIWAKIELKDAWKKIKEELKDARAWLIDSKLGIAFPTNGETQELLYSREDYKAPLIAESALKIAWEMIERCQNLPDTLLRTQFIRSTSARLIWHFFNFLVLQCKRIDFYDDSPADDSLTTLCTSINAARYCESKLLEWSDDMNLSGMRITENEANDSNCFFGEDIKSLAELETTWLIEVIAILLRQFETLSWGYVQTKECFEQKREDYETISVSEDTDFTVSVDFIEALDAVRSQLHVIRMNLNPKDFFDLWRSVADGLDHFIFGSILMSDTRFSDDGINQFLADMQALFLVFQPFCFRPDAFFPCLRDSLKLLKMSKEVVKQLWVVLCDEDNRIKHLRSLGVSRISFDQARKVLRNRKSGI